MSLLTQLKKNLTEEQYNAVKDALGDDFDYDVVPRSRLNKVIKQRNQYKDQLEHPSNADEDDEDDDDEGDEGEGADNKAKGKTPAGKGKPDKNTSNKSLTEEEIEAAKQKAAADAVASLKLEYAVKNKLKEANAKDVDLVYGLLDATKLAFDDKGVLTGLDDQVKGLTESKDFLFGVDSDKSAKGGTGKGGSGAGGNAGAVDSQIQNVFSSFGITPVEE